MFYQNYYFHSSSKACDVLIQVANVRHPNPDLTTLIDEKDEIQTKWRAYFVYVKDGKGIGVNSTNTLATAYQGVVESVQNYPYPRATLCFKTVSNADYPVVFKDLEIKTSSLYSDYQAFSKKYYNDKTLNEKDREELHAVKERYYTNYDTSMNLKALLETCPYDITTESVV